MTMQLDIPEIEALLVAVGQHAQVWLDNDHSRAPHEAEVIRVGYALNPTTRTLPVEIALENKEGRLRPGMYGRAAIDYETHANVLTAPSSIFYVSSSHCYRVIDGRAVLTNYVAKYANSSRIEIESGLSEGDLVIVAEIPDGMEKISLRNGTPVEIIEQDE